MGDPQDVWINVTNAVLGGVVLLLVLGTLLAAAAELLGRWKRRTSFRAEIDRDFLREMRLYARQRQGPGTPAT